jgi:hypothetical protein
MRLLMRIRVFHRQVVSRVVEKELWPDAGHIPNEDNSYFGIGYDPGKILEGRSKLVLSLFLALQSASLLQRRFALRQYRAAFPLV